MSTEIQAGLNDIQFRRGTAENIKKFRGKLGSFAFTTDDHMRLVIFDGNTLGGASRVALLESADFTCTPTVPSVSADDLEDIPDNAVLNIADTRKVMAALGEDVLAEKIDHTLELEEADLNTFNTDGFYHVINASNAPSGTQGYLLIFSKGSTYAQYWVTSKLKSGKLIPEMYMRLQGTDTTEWCKYISSSELNIDDIAYLSSNNIFYKDVEIRGELTGPTIEGKLDHTIKSTVPDLDLMLEDGLFYFNSSSAVANAPESVTEFFLHVRTCETVTVQEVLLLQGKVYFRNNKNGTFSEWKVQEINLPDATDTKPGIVKISDLPVQGASSTAFSAHGAYEFDQRIQTNYNQSQANQEAITALVAHAEKCVTTVIIPDAANEYMVEELEVKSGTVTFPAASVDTFGLSRPATKDEVIYKTDRDVFITPSVYRDTVDPIVEEGIKTAFGIEDISGSAVEAVVDKVLADSEFIKGVTETVSKTSTKVKVMSNAEFNPEMVEDNTLYLISE